MTQKKIILNGVWLAIYTIGIFFLGHAYALWHIANSIGEDTAWNYEITSGIRSGISLNYNVYGTIGIILLVIVITIRIPELYHYFKKTSL